MKSNERQMIQRRINITCDTGTLTHSAFRSVLFTAIIILFSSIVVMPSYAASPVFSGTAANVWSFDASGETIGSYYVGSGTWTSKAAYSIPGYVMINDAYSVNVGTSGSGVLINQISSGLPAASSDLPKVSVVGLDTALLNAANSAQPAVNISPVPGTYNRTVNIMFESIAAPAGSGDVTIHWQINGTAERTNTGRHAGFSLVTDGTCTVRYWASQNGVESPRKDAVYTIAVPSGTNRKDWLRRDTDGDGIPDIWESENGLDPLESDLAQDSDGDGWSDFDEVMRGTDPNNSYSKPVDTDWDGWSDFDERLRGTNPNDPVFVDIDTSGPGHGTPDMAVRTAPDENFVAMTTDNSGNVYVTGWEYYPHPMNQESAIVTVKYSPEGRMLWTAFFDTGDSNLVKPAAIAADAGGNVYIAGSDVDAVTNAEDIVAIKYDANGSKLWSRTYNGAGNGGDRAAGLAVDGSGNVYVTGYSTGVGTGYDVVTVKYDALGNLIWARTYNGAGNGNDSSLAITLDAAGNIYVTGYSTGAGSGLDIVILKYDSAGVQKWIRQYMAAGSYADAATAITTDSASNIIVTGISYSAAGGKDFITIKYDPAGTQKWLKQYSGEGSYEDVPVALKVDNSDNIIVAGYSYSSLSNYDFITFKYDSGGVQQWVKTYNGTANGSDSVTAVATDNAGNIYVTGECRGGASDRDAVTLKYDSAGNQLWASVYNGPRSKADSGRSIRTDSSGNVYAAGSSTGIGTGLDYFSMKYDPNGTQLWNARYDGTGYAPYDNDNDGVPDFDTSQNIIMDSNSDGTADMAVYNDTPAATRLYEVEHYVGWNIYRDAAQTQLQYFMEDLSVLDIYWNVLYDKQNIPGTATLNSQGLDENAVPYQHRLSIIQNALNSGKLNNDSIPPVVRVPAGNASVIRSGINNEAGAKWVVKAWLHSKGDLTLTGVQAYLNSLTAGELTSLGLNADWTTAEEWKAGFIEYLRHDLVNKVNVDLSPESGLGIALLEGLAGWYSGSEGGGDPSRQCGFSEAAERGQCDRGPAFRKGNDSRDDCCFEYAQSRWPA